MAILTGTDYCRCRQKFCSIPFSGSVGCLTLWSKLVTFASCSLIHGPFDLCVLGVYLFMITVTWSIEARLKTRMFQIKSVPRAILLFLASVLFLHGTNDVDAGLPSSEEDGFWTHQRKLIRRNWVCVCACVCAWLHQISGFKFRKCFFVVIS